MNTPIPLSRCPWCESDIDYINYHDQEWGRLIDDDTRLFEFLILEGAQAGLSWKTILKRRSNYKIAFANFNPALVAKFTIDDCAHLMLNEGIIRNRLKIKSAINNAIHFLEIQKEFGSFFNYVCTFFPQNPPVINHPQIVSEIPITSTISDKLSADMKKRGFTFFGSTICYAYLQAMGFIDDHLDNCFLKK